MNQFTISCQQKLYAGVSAVHRENDTCDIAGLFASKKTSGSIQFSFFSDSCHRSMGFDVGFKILLCLCGHFGVNFSGHFCFKISLADGIYRNIVLCQFGGCGTGEIDHTTFCGMVSDGPGEHISDQAIHGGDVDDPAIKNLKGRCSRSIRTSRVFPRVFF